MKTIREAIIGAVALSFASAIQSFAVEGLQLSVQSSNVVLSWPSTNTETYIVRYRPTLTPDSSWLTLTDYFAAASDTNITVFVHSNIVQYPPSSPGGGGGGNIMPDGMSGAASGSSTTTDQGVLMAVPADGSGRAAPLMIYPSGFDLSGFTIFDPVTGESVSGNGYSVKAAPMDTMQAGGIQPMDGSGDTNQYTGFYQVARDGVHIYGMTNGMVLSGQVPLPIEFGDVDTNRSVAEIFLSNNDSDDDIPGSTFPDFPLGAGISPNGVWDTTQVTNGTYLLQVGAKMSDETLYMDNPVSVTVSNVMWLPDSWNVGGQAIYVGVQTAFTNGTWHLDIYDDQNDYVGYLDGSLDTNGYCAYPGISGPGFSLNNTDGQGNQNPSTLYTMAMTVHPANTTPPYPTLTNTVLIEPSWNISPTYAVTCYMQVFNPIKEGYNEVIQMMQAIWSVEQDFHPNVLGSGEIPFQVQTLGDWATVVSKLRDNANRDFIYFGHGSGTALGPDQTTSITTNEIENTLKNNSKNPLDGPNRHPYRFVYMDGCETADGNWPQVFGIPKKAGMVTADFTNKRGIRPRAFFGWNRKKYFNMELNTSGFLDPDFLNWRTDFWRDFAERDGQGNPKYNITTAATAADTNDNGIHNSFGGGRMIYGASDLVIDY